MGNRYTFLGTGGVGAVRSIVGCCGFDLRDVDARFDPCPPAVLQWLPDSGARGPPDG
jgi:hypothetical protein